MMFTEKSRRQLLGSGRTLALSGAAVALLGGAERLASSPAFAAATMQDVDILNVALGLEWEAIGAYQLGAESGLLAKPALDVAVLFQSHHKEHAAALSETIRKLGGTPVATKSGRDYATALNAASLKSATDVLRLAAKLERGAVEAYLGVIPSFSDAGLAKVAGRLAADETMHWTALSSTLGDMLPGRGLTFGA